MLRRICLGVILASLSVFSWAEIIDCTIRGVYENKNGVLAQRPSDAALNEALRIDLGSGVVSGYFGTDGDEVSIIPVSQGFLSIERARGLYGESANRMSVLPSSENKGQILFTYNKNWLVITGVCREGT